MKLEGEGLNDSFSTSPSEIPLLDEEEIKIKPDEANEEVEEDVGLFRDYYRLFRRNPHYLYIWMSDVVSMLGDWFNELACILVLQKFSDSGLLLTLFFLCREIPSILWTPITGWVSDTFDRKKIMIICDMLRAILVLGFILVRNKETLWLLFFVSFLQFTCTAFFYPAFKAAIPMVVEERYLVKANILEAVTWSVQILIGAALGGFVAAFFGVTISFFVDSLSYVGSALCLARLIPLIPKKKEVENQEEVELESTESIEEPSLEKRRKLDLLSFARGFIYLLGNNYCFVVALAKAGGAAVWAGVELVNVKVCSNIYTLGKGGSLSLSVIYMSTGLGVGFLPFLIQKFTKDTENNSRKLIVLGFFALLSGTLAQSFFSFYWIYLLGNIWRTCGSGLVWAHSSAILQKKIPNHLLGRVVSFELASLTFTSVVARILFGVLWDSAKMNPFHINLIFSLVALALFIFWTFFIGYHLRKSKPEEKEGLVENFAKSSKEEEKK